jgi:DNA-binding response OmpR family regulator
MPLQRVLAQTRQRFVAAFPAQCESMRLLVDQVAALGPRGPVAALSQVTHRMSGLAGSIGFPTVSVRASELERLVEDVDGFDALIGRAAVDAIGVAFRDDEARAAAVPQPAGVPHGTKILVVEDDPDQRGIVTACLEDAGYAAVGVVSGDLVLAAARSEQPALILLDIALPRVDGYSVCRLLKADPELAGIPVVFITAGANLDGRLAGLALGADDFLFKPVDMRELVLRIRIVLDRCRAKPPSAAVARELTYEAFLAVAGEELGRAPAAIAMLRLPSDRHGEAAVLLAAELRARDAIGLYDVTRMLMLMPETNALEASTRLQLLVGRLDAHGLQGTCAGISAAAQGTKTAAALIGEADEAMTEARYMGHQVAIWNDHLGRSFAVPAPRTVLVADDDPEVTRMVEAQVQAAAHTVLVALDGEQALAAVRAHAPDVVVLDLTMPTVDGFEVLRQIRDGRAPRPRVIVLSASDREADVVRAFALGADDYLTKPFNPAELMSRIARLLA